MESKITGELLPLREELKSLNSQIALLTEKSKASKIELEEKLSLLLKSYNFIFKEGGKISAYQDYSFIQSLPSSVIFSSDGKSFGDRISIYGDGFGNLEKPNAYGNGRLFISLEELIESFEWVSKDAS